MHRNPVGNLAKPFSSAAAVADHQRFAQQYSADGVSVWGMIEAEQSGTQLLAIETAGKLSSLRALPQAASVSGCCAAALHDEFPAPLNLPDC
jgi:hypothetical protein